MTTELSVIIPTRNRLGLLKQKLRTLFAQTLPCNAFEVVVCDDGSDDGTGAYLRDLETPFKLTVCRAEGKGAAAARNRAAAAATGHMLLLSDDDCLLDPGALEAHLNAHARFSKSVVVGRLKLPEALRAGRGLEPFERTFKVGRRALWINATGANTSVPAWAFRQVGGYDTRYSGYGGEDPHLALKLRALDLRFRRAPDALAFHADRQLAGAFEAKAFAAGRAQWQVYQDFPEPSVGLLLGVHPLILALKWVCFQPVIARRITHPGYRYERAYYLGACKERRRDKGQS